LAQTSQRLISDEIAAFLSQGLSTLVGTCSAARIPQCVRAVGIRLHAERTRAAVFLPAATSEKTVANLRDNPRIAVLASYPLDHRSLQLKGAVLGVAPAPESDRAYIDAYMSTFASVLEVVGMPYEVVTMVTHWPALTVEFAIEELYVQTPGPGAGAKFDGQPL
jgi:hypothetical protein